MKNTFGFEIVFVTILHNNERLTEVSSSSFKFIFSTINEIDNKIKMTIKMTYMFKA